MVALKGLIKQFSILAVELLRVFRINPDTTSLKVLERIRRSLPSSFSSLIFGLEQRLLSQPSNEIADLLRSGQFGLAARLIIGAPDGYSSLDRRSTIGALRKVDPSSAQIQPSTTPVVPRGKPSVLHIVTNSLPHTQSGYTLRTHNILKGQQEIGIDVRAVTRLNYPLNVGRFSSGELEIVDGVEYFRIFAAGAKKDNTYRNRVSDLCKSAGVNLLHTTTNYMNAAMTSAIAAQLGLPWIYEVRGEPESTWLSKMPKHLHAQARESEFYRFAREHEILASRSASAVIVLSDVYRGILVERGVDPEKIFVVPNGVSAEDIMRGKSYNKSELRASLGLPTDRTVIGIISSLVSYEGIDVLIEAAKTLPTDLNILIVGEGEQRGDLERMAAARGVADRVHFVGQVPRDEVWKWYAVLDAFILPRHDESVTRRVTPIKALQAQAYGVPVIASDLPAIREITGNFETYFPAGDSDALAAVIVETVARNDDQVRRKHWAGLHEWRLIAQKYEAIYAKVLSSLIGPC